MINLLPQETHGGSMRYVITKQKNDRNVSIIVKKYLSKEKKQNLHNLRSCINFKKKCFRLKKNLREKLSRRVQELSSELENDRFEQELLFLSQKMDVEEEVDRLNAHVDEVIRVIDQNGPIGRRLDFLMQEMNREANTLGSKSYDLHTSNASVELKVLIEQMREQIQNIE